MADVKIYTDMIEDAAKEQIANIASLPAFKDSKIRIMPDVHAGKGCVCGFTADLGDKVVPNLIGVDIGCGMFVVELGKIDIDFEKLDATIRKLVPSGKSVHDSWTADYDGFGADPRLCIAPTVHERADYFDRSLGTLGGGNHFVEIDADADGNKYLIIHTGSRNFGKVVCDYWQDVAAKNMPGTEITDADIDSLFD